MEGVKDLLDKYLSEEELFHISLVKSQWEEPKKCSLLERKLVDFNTNESMTFMTVNKFENWHYLE